jgi:hypothetical protein
MRGKDTLAKGGHLELYQAQDGNLLEGFEAMTAVLIAVPSGSLRRFFCASRPLTTMLQSRSHVTLSHVILAACFVLLA